MTSRLGFRKCLPDNYFLTKSHNLNQIMVKSDLKNRNLQLSHGTHL